MQIKRYELPEKKKNLKAANFTSRLSVLFLLLFLPSPTFSINFPGSRCCVYCWCHWLLRLVCPFVSAFFPSFLDLAQSPSFFAPNPPTTSIASSVVISAMEQIVLDYSPPVIDHTTALAASHPSVWSSLFVAANVSAPSNSSFCFDGCGWGPFTPDFQMTPCFIDGVLFGALSIFLLVLGVYQLYVLSARHPFPSPLNWHFFTKLVSPLVSHHLIPLVFLSVFF